jgi:anti-sigma factor RsiW
MDHKAAQDLFSEYIEGELAPDVREALRQHLDGCQPCQTEFLAFRKTVDSVSGLFRLPPPEDFGKKIEVKLRKRSRGRFFGEDQTLLRVPFEWLSFVVIMLLLLLYLSVTSQKVLPEKGVGKHKTVTSGASDQGPDSRRAPDLPQSPERD